MIRSADGVHSHKYRMTQLTVLPLSADEPRADVLLFPEAHLAPSAIDASGNSLISLEPPPSLAETDDVEPLPSQAIRVSATFGRRDAQVPSSSRLIAADAQANATSNERLSAIVREQSRNVWRALRRLGVPIDWLDDATQEVFIIASRKLHFIEPGAERSFLYGTALRVAANLRRSHKARQFAPLDETDRCLWQTGTGCRATRSSETSSRITRSNLG